MLTHSKLEGTSFYVYFIVFLLIENLDFLYQILVHARQMLYKKLHLQPVGSLA
jgi:hypothetical protein